MASADECLTDDDVAKMGEILKVSHFFIFLSIRYVQAKYLLGSVCFCASGFG